MISLLSSLLRGKKLVAFVGVITLASILEAILYAGTYQAALPEVMRPTAHMAFAFFWIAFTASSLNTIMPNAYSRWAVKNRRYAGLSFALIHGIHAILVLSNLSLNNESRPILIFLAGVMAYMFIGIMALTSNATSIKKMGAKNWQRLHKTGSWYIWLIFMSALPEVLQGKYNRVWLFTLGFIALGLRIAAYQKKKYKAAH